MENFKHILKWTESVVSAPETSPQRQQLETAGLSPPVSGPASFPGRDGSDVDSRHHPVSPRTFQSVSLKDVDLKGNHTTSKN